MHFNSSSEHFLSIKYYVWGDRSAKEKIDPLVRKCRVPFSACIVGIRDLAERCSHPVVVSQEGSWPQASHDPSEKQLKWGGIHEGLILR